MQRLSLFILILSLFWVSCSSDEFEIKEVGSSLIPPNTEVQLIDTFTVRVSSFIMDSIPTSNAKTMLVGQYTDEYFGKIKSVGYSKLRIKKPFSVDPQNKQVFDSLVFIAHYNQYYYGDTTKVQHINFHRISNVIKRPSNDTLYNINKFDYDAKPLGSIQFKATPLTKKTAKNIKNNGGNATKIPSSLRIKLDDNLGKQIIKLAQEHSDTLVHLKKWEKLMPGFCLVPNADDNAAIIGLHTVNRVDTLMVMRLYYHEKSGSSPNTTKTYDFNLGDFQYIFNNIEADRKGTALESLKTQQEDIATTLTNNAAYIQGGIGIKTKIEIPYLRTLYQLGITGSLLKAELLVFPQPKTFNKSEFPLPPTFTLARSDRRNRVLSVLRDPNKPESALLARLIEDRQYEEDYYYSFNITNFVNGVLSNIYTSESQSLIMDLLPPYDTSSVDRVILSNSKKNLDLKFKIKATYVVQKSE